jgi:adenylate cyclase
MEFLAGRPQVIMHLGVHVLSHKDVLLDLMSRSALGNGAVPELTLLLWEGSAKLAQIVTERLTALGHPEVRTRMLIVLGLPAVTDQRYAATRRAYREIAEYLGNENFASAPVDYHFTAGIPWLQVNFLATVLRQIDPRNITRLSIIDHIFNAGLFTVDDMTFGVYSGNCDDFRAERGFACSCNEGYRTTELYSMTEDYRLVPLPDGTVQSSFAECGDKAASLTPPLVLLSVCDRATPLRLAAAAALLQSTKAFASSLYENCSVAAGGNITKAVAGSVASLYVSIAFPADAAVELATVDPFYFPAQLAPTQFDERQLHLVATLQQEIHALASMAAAKDNARCFAAVRSAQAPKIVVHIEASLNTFGTWLASMTASTDTAAPLVLPAAWSGFVFVVGMAAAADVRAVVDFLRASPAATVLLAFSELSVLYADVVSLTQAANVDDRVLFATSLVNWNLRTNQSTDLTNDYFDKFPQAEARTPLSLRGFIVDAAIRKIADQVLPEMISSATFLSTLYSVSVIALSSEIVLGPVSRANCLSELDTTCRTNTGARVLRIFALSDVANTSSAQASTAAVQRPEFRFASGRMEYRSLPTAPPPLLTTVAIAGISAGGALFLVLAAAAVWWLRTSGKRNNEHAPRDPSQPVTLLFTDIESSTSLWALVPEQMAPAMDAHHDLIRGMIHKHRCYEVKTIGDAFMIATSDANSAVALAVELQYAFFTYANWGREIDDAYLELEVQRAAAAGGTTNPSSLLLSTLPEEAYRSMWNGLRVRTGIHTGLCEIKQDPTTHGVDYYGTTVNTAARVEASASGGQIILTRATLEQLSPALRSSAQCVGEHELRGVPGKTELFLVPTLPGRTFRDGGPWNGGDAAEGESQPDPLSLGRGSGESGQANNSNSKEQVKYGASYTEPWAAVAAHVLVTLLSTLQRDRQVSFLSTVCERMRLPVHESGPSPTRTADDPHVIALAKRLGTLMQRKYGPMATTNNFLGTESMGSSAPLSIRSPRDTRTGVEV